MRAHEQIQVISADPAQTLVHRIEHELAIVLSPVDLPAVLLLQLDVGARGFGQFAALGVEVVADVIRSQSTGALDLVAHLGVELLLFGIRQALVDILIELAAIDIPEAHFGVEEELVARPGLHDARVAFFATAAAIGRSSVEIIQPHVEWKFRPTGKA